MQNCHWHFLSNDWRYLSLFRRLVFYCLYLLFALVPGSATNNDSTVQFPWQYVAIHLPLRRIRVRCCRANHSPLPDSPRNASNLFPERLQLLTKRQQFLFHFNNWLLLHIIRCDLHVRLHLPDLLVLYVLRHLVHLEVDLSR